MEIDRYRKLTQQDTKAMYDDALEEKNQVKRMDQLLDEVSEPCRDDQMTTVLPLTGRR